VIVPGTTGECTWTALYAGNVIRGVASSLRCAICKAQIAILLMATSHQQREETAWH
jgi:hypothetical protein